MDRCGRCQGCLQPAPRKVCLAPVPRYGEETDSGYGHK